ncbi:MAG TPA: cobalt transporter CbiM [Bacteroidales bacterium]
MHIPDGYLSPQTYVPLYVVFIAFISVAVRKIKRKLTVKLIPFLGMASAFSFLIMMFNIPIPGGTSGHAVGAALIALILGPWVAIVSVSVALILQALIFGDGGITAIGANCINMAVIISFVAYYTFKVIRGKSEKPARIGIAAFFAGYAGLCVAAVVTAVELGIQPLISSENGQALHSPFPLSIALPVMAVENLLVFGIVEGFVTAVLFKYFYKNNHGLIEVLKP